MSKILKPISILFFVIFVISCASPGDLLKQSNPEIYQDIVGTCYILSEEKQGEIRYTISFHHDGTITGDTKPLFQLEKAKWKFIAGNRIKINTVNIVTTIDFNIDPDSLHWTDQKNLPRLKKNIIPGAKFMHIEWKESWSAGSALYIYTKDMDDIIAFKNLEAKQELEDKKRWENLNYKSVKAHYDFIKNVKNKDLKSNAELSLHKLLDAKTIQYLKKNFKLYAKYSQDMIIYENGTELCRLYEFLKFPITFKNKHSGEKFYFTLEKNYSQKNVFDIVCSINGKELNILLKPYKNKLILVGLSSGYQVNPKSWEFGVSAIATAWNQYPEDIDNIDIDLLDKL